jgi:hypothetical protein
MSLQSPPNQPSNFQEPCDFASCFLQNNKEEPSHGFLHTEDLGHIEPRDPSAIDQRPTFGSDGGNIFSLVILLVITAVAFGLYFLYADTASTQRTVIAPSTTQLSPAPAHAPSPAAQPPTQTPTP